MAIRSSFSQHNLFEKCARWWYFQYIQRLPVSSDMSYAHAGNAIHKTLQQYYDGKVSDVEKIKEIFSNYWEGYKLHQGKLNLKKDEYWLMILNGLNLKLEVTSTELKIFYPEVVGYLDVVNTQTDEIGDWKSSKRSEDNEKEYKKQLMLYAWIYHRKFERVPNKVTVYYLRYNGTKGELYAFL